MKSNPDFEARQRTGSPGGNDRQAPRRDNRPQQSAPAGNDWFSQAMNKAKK
jgi:hypothetical protein